MTENEAPTRGRRSRRFGWFLPLVVTPVIFFAGILIAGVLDGGGAPEVLWRVPWGLGIGGAVLSFALFVVRAVRALSPGANRRFTPETGAEHLNAGVVRPPAPATGLLVFAVVLTMVSLGVAALFIVNLPHTLGLAPDAAVEWGPASSGVWLIVAVIATPVIWRQYAAARLAQKQYRARLDDVGASEPSRPVVAVRRHRSWVLPVLTIPIIIFAAVLVVIGLRSVDAPRDAIRAVSIVMLVGIAVALVVVVIAIVRFVRAPPAPRTPPMPAFYERLSTADATRRGLSRDEYGVYKGNVGSMVVPVNSAGGILFLAILLTVLNAFILVLIGVGIAQVNGVIPPNPADRGLTPVEWGFLVLEFMFVPIAWRYYIVERRAHKLRASRGLPKNLR